MDLLGFLKEKKGELSPVTHPYTYSDSTFKYLYCFGIGVMTLGHMKAISEMEDRFMTFLEMIKLNPTDRNRIIIDINNNFDYKITEVFKILDTKEKQYTFLSDLLKLSNGTLWSQSYCEEVINSYISVFGLDTLERNFINDFILLSRRKQTGEAIQRYRDFNQAGYEISYMLLKYMSGDLLIEETFTDLVIEHGETIVLDKPTLLNGTILVRNGSSLMIENAQVKINGTIIIDGGRIRMRHTNLFVTGTTDKSVIKVVESTQVLIEDSIIDCNFKGGFIQQAKGCLRIDNSRIMHTKNERAIVITGNYLILNGTNIEDALDGGLSIQNDTTSTIDDCNFYHCEAEHGAAIYSNAVYDTKISNSSFRNCVAKYLGGSVYFLTKKYGQELYGCHFVKCLPKDSNVFNDYQSKNNVWDDAYET